MGAILFSLLLLFPAQKTPSPLQKTADKCTLQGVVVKAESGEPLKKAVVTLRQEGNRDQGTSAVTDATGRFEIKVDPGRYHASASRNGYVRQEFGERAPDGAGTILTLTAGQKVSDLSFRLIPAAVITGHVYDDDGEPVVEAQVSALHYSYLRGQRELLNGGFATTNDRGEFRIYGLAPGQYYVRAAYNPGWRSPESGPGGYLPVFYPGTADVGTASPIILHSGDETSGINLNLQSIHTVTIRGRVANSISGRPGVHAGVFLVRREPAAFGFGPVQNTFVQDPQGAFELRDVPPGAYYLYADLHEEDNDYVARMPIEAANTDIEGIILNVTRGPEIRGQLHVEGTTSLDAAALAVHLQPKGGVIFLAGMVASDSVKSDGSFVLRNVSDGDYDLYVFTLPEDFYLKSARLDGNDVLASGLTIDAQQSPKLLELVVSANGARVEGSVTKDQQPFSGATVVLVPDPPQRNNRRLYGETTTDQYGHFVLRGIAPGDYKLFAWESVERGAYRNADFLQAFEDRGHAVHVTEGAQLTVQVNLIPAKDSSAEPAVRLLRSTPDRLCGFSSSARLWRAAVEGLHGQPGVAGPFDYAPNAVNEIRRRRWK